MTRALAVFILLIGAGGAAFAQAQPKSSSQWDQSVDLKPLVPVLPHVFIPPNSQLNAGGLSGSQVSTPLNDPYTNSAPAPGLRLTIPTH